MKYSRPKKLNRFVLLRELKYDVRVRGGEVVLPAGTKNVYCKFRGSPGTYVDPDDGKVKHLNVYLKDGRYVHGY